MNESIHELRDSTESFLSDAVICTLHLVSKGAIEKEGSFAEAENYWKETGKDCTKCEYHDDCALMIMEE